MAKAGGITYHVQAILGIRRTGAQKKQIASFAKGLTMASDRLQSTGRAVMGNMASMAASVARTGLLIGAGLGFAGVIGFIGKAIALNAEFENQTFAIASSLQLMARNGSEFTKNIEEANWIMGELEKRAAASPASFEQAQELFREMLPGAIQVTDNMGKILDMAEAALTLGVQMGGDFRQAGADLRRILTGQAGADVRAWVEGMGTAISSVGAEMGGEVGEAIGGQTGEALTKSFNQLDPTQRFELVERAVMRLGPATAAAAKSWQGLTSTAQSVLTWLTRLAGAQAFETIKGRLEEWTREDGILGKAGKEKLEGAARFLGAHIGRAFDWALDKFETLFHKVANNWQDIADRFQKIVGGIKAAAKAATAVGVARTVAGAGLLGAGKVAGGLSGLLQAAPSVGVLIRAVGGLGPAALVAAPLLATLGITLAAFAIIGAGVLAYFIDNWDQLLKGIQDGTVDITSLVEAASLLWWRMTQLGAVFVGSKDPIEGVNNGIVFLVSAMSALTTVMAWVLRAMVLVQVGFNLVTLAFRAIHLAATAAAYGIVAVFHDLVEGIVGAGSPLLGPIKAVVDQLSGTMAETKRNVNTDIEDIQVKKLRDGIKALEATREFDPDALKLKVEQLTRAPGAGAFGGGGAPERPKAPVTNINKVIVNQDLRGEDPDRVIGRFNKALEKVSRMRNQPFQPNPGGI